MLPINLKSRAKYIRDIFMNNDRFWLNDKQGLIIDGDVISKSNICIKIIELMTSCPSSGESIQPKRNDISTKSTKSRILQRPIKFESLYDNDGDEDFVEISFRFG